MVRPALYWLRTLERMARIYSDTGSEEEKGTREIIGKDSVDADLTIIGFRNEKLSTEGYKLFNGYEKLGNVLFVSANKKKEIN